jgi:serine protease Do
VEERDMNDTSLSQSKDKRLSAHRLILLSSAASIAVAVVAGGPSGNGVLNSLVTPAHAAIDTQAQAGFADVVAKVKPAVISVKVKVERTAQMSQQEDDEGGAIQLPPGHPLENYFKQFEFRDMPERPRGKQMVTGEGSGFFISADGYAVTNSHVVDQATTVQVTTDDGAAYDAKVIGTDARTDLALIKVDGDKNFPYVKFAQDDPRIGDWVIAVGSPFGLAGTVTAGIISARGWDIGSRPHDEYVQIDAPINKGNSGGPAFNVNGEVIGVNTAIFSPSGGSVGIGFDIPANTAKRVVAQLKEHGSVQRGWLGVQIQPVTADVADSIGLKKAEGALVDEPQATGPAAKAGIVAGDVITAINDVPVKDPRDLARRIEMTEPGTSIKLTLQHKGEQKVLNLRLGNLPTDQQTKAEVGSDASANGLPRLGLTIAPAIEVAGSGDQGVAVVEVDASGPAAERGVKTGDVILDVGGKVVASAVDVRKALSEAQTAGKKTVLMRVKRANTTSFIAVPIAKA